MEGRTLRREHYYLLVFIVLLACLAAYRASHITLDCSIFLSMAHHMQQGRLLYTGIWDNKPPLTYLLYFLAYSLFPDVRVVHLLRFMAFGFTGLTLTLVLIRRKDDIKTIVLTMVPALLLLHCLNEQNCSADLLGLCCFLAFWVAAIYFRSWAVASFFAALAVLCKEPFCLVILPWLIQGFWALSESVDSEQLKRRRLGMFFAFLLPNLIFLAYLLATGTFNDYLYTLAVNFAYSQRKTSQSIVGFFLFSSTTGQRLILPLLIFMLYQLVIAWPEGKTEDGVLLFGLVMSAIALSLAKRDYLNYSVMAFGPIVLALHKLLCTTLEELTKKEWKVRKVVPTLFLAYFASLWILLGIMVYQQQSVAVDFLGWDYWNSYRKNAMFQYLETRVRQGDGLWLPYGGLYWLYPALNQLSPTAMHFYFTSVHGRPNESSRKKLLHYYAEVRSNPPKYIIDGGTDETAILLAEPVMRSWLLKNYKKVVKKKSNGDQLVLWQHL